MVHQPEVRLQRVLPPRQDLVRQLRIIRQHATWRVEVLWWVVEQQPLPEAVPLPRRACVLEGGVHCYGLKVGGTVQSL